MIEIERKYLIKPTEILTLKRGRGKNIVQSYLKEKSGIELRLRIMEDEGFLTVKKSISQRSRHELETKVDSSFIKNLLKTFNLKKLEKTRYSIVYKNKLWEIDFFKGKHEGLVLAEIELNDENEVFELPSWIEKEVTNDKRYYNSYLFELL